jgi:hypothetical protein
MAANVNASDRLERACLEADWRRNGQVASTKMVLPGLTEELFLAAGEALEARVELQRPPVRLVEALRDLAMVQGILARGRP